MSMSFFLTLVGLSVVAASAGADVSSLSVNGSKIDVIDWRLLTEHPDGSLTFYRLPVTHGESNYLRMWERYEYNESQNDAEASYRSEVIYVEFDCGARRFRSLQRETFKANNLNGGISFTYRGPSEWIYIVPDTDSESEFKVACGDDARGRFISVEQPEIDPEVVNRAVREFRDELKAGGVIRTEDTSRNCYKKLQENIRWSVFDYCVSFDLSGLILDAAMAQNVTGTRVEYFLDSNVSSRVYTAGVSLNLDKTRAGARLIALRDMVEPELLKVLGEGK